MVNKLKLSNRTKYILVEVMIIIFSFCLSSLYNEGKIIIPQDNKTLKYSVSGTENYDVSLKDLVLNGDIYTSTTADPYITVSFKEPQEVQEICLSLSVEDEDNKTMFQVFFRDSQSGFSEEDSVRTTVSSGEYTIRLSEATEYAGLRLDITNEQGTAITISSVEFFCKGNTDLLLGLFPIFITCVLYFSIAFALFVFKQAGKVGDRRFCLGELLLSVLFTAGVVFVKMYSDGNMYAYIDIGSDTINSYLPFYTYVSDSLREGVFEIWSGEYGYGNTMFSMLYDPLMVCVSFLTVLFGNGFLIPGLVAHKFICLLLSGYFCYKFLGLFSNKYPLVAIAAYLYAFNGFENIWGQHYFFASYPVFAIMVFYGVEKYLRKQKKFSPFIVIISCLCMATSVYPCYMIYLSAAVYALIRYFYMIENFKLKPFILKFSGMLANVLIGFGMGMFTGLPGIVKIMNTGRVGGSGLLQKFKSAAELNFLNPWWDMPRRMLTGPQTEYSFNYYEDQQLFFSILSVVIILQFLLTIHKAYKKPRQMICVYVSAALALFAVFNGTIPFALNAFAAVGVYRGLYVLFPAAALMTLSVLDNICYKKIFSYEAAAVGGIISVLALLAPSMWRSDLQLFPGVKGIIPMCVFFLMISVTVLIRLYRSKNKQFAIIMLCAVLGLDCVAELHITFNRGSRLLSEERYEMWQENNTETQVLLDKVYSIDDDYCRIDKTYHDFNQFTDSLMENYKGLTLYDSTLNTRMRKFFAEYMPQRYNRSNALKVYALAPNELVQWSMMGLRYVLSKYESYDTDHFKPVSEYNGIILYKLTDSESFGTFYTKAVSYDDFSELNLAEKTKILQSSVVLEENFNDSTYGVTIKEAIDALEEQNITEQVLSEGNYSLPQVFEKEQRLEFKFVDNWSENIDGEIFMEYCFTADSAGAVSMFIDTGNGYREVDRCVTNVAARGIAAERLALPRNTKSVRFDFPHSKVMLEYFTVTVTDAPLRPNECNAVIKDTGSDSHLLAEINCTQNGLLFIPVPFDENWNAYVDGHQSEIIIANSGFMAIDLTQGEHQVEFVYKNKTLIYGITISIFSLACAVLFWYMDMRKKPKKNK